MSAKPVGLNQGMDLGALVPHVAYVSLTLRVTEKGAFPLHPPYYNPPTERERKRYLDNISQTDTLLRINEG